jgi:importin subunit alpha-1
MRARGEKQLKNGLNADTQRTKRIEVTVQLRKNARESNIAKKRLESANITANKGFLAQNELDAIIGNLYSQHVSLQTLAIEHVRAVLSTKLPPIQQLLNAKVVVPKLIAVLSCMSLENNLLQDGILIDSAWALTNMLSGTNEQTRIVLGEGALQALSNAFCMTQNPKLKEQALWALANIAGDCAEFRNQVLAEQQVIDSLVSELSNDACLLSLKRVSAWCLSNLCRYKPSPDHETASKFISVSTRLLQKYARDPEIRHDACWALRYLSDDDTPNNIVVKEMLRQGAPNLLFAQLEHKECQGPIVTAAGLLMSGEDPLETTTMLNYGVLKYLAPMLTSPNYRIRHETCFSLSNITAGNDQQVKAVVDSGVLDMLLSTMANDVAQVRLEAMWVIANALSSCPDLVVSRTCAGDSVDVKVGVDIVFCQLLCNLHDSMNAKHLCLALQVIFLNCLFCNFFP